MNSPLDVPVARPHDATDGRARTDGRTDAIIFIIRPSDDELVSLAVFYRLRTTVGSTLTIMRTVAGQPGGRAEGRR